MRFRWFTPCRLPYLSLCHVRTEHALSVFLFLVLSPTPISTLSLALVCFLPSCLVSPACSLPCSVSPPPSYPPSSPVFHNRQWQHPDADQSVLEITQNAALANLFEKMNTVIREQLQACGQCASCRNLILISLYIIKSNPTKED